MVFHGNSPKRLGSVPIYTSSYIASYITCIYFAVASKIIGMRPEYLTGLRRPALENPNILNKSKATRLVFYLQEKQLTLSEHRL